ncbi:hypothetical protein NPIL_165041 [Nephila pilipes]|uniref:Uncharacterized protein n=1 Tax=Nephila pilipes TaxID=299642 RepID=A0A8X6T712_NEPPI|nr:hypothetical protein NPIL_381571 [Nephila pilipes]GFT72161.1 hypothetical protein NPIL_165041 [Nephila pilipes]
MFCWRQIWGRAGGSTGMDSLQSVSYHTCRMRMGIILIEDDILDDKLEVYDSRDLHEDSLAYLLKKICKNDAKIIDKMKPMPSLMMDANS